MQPVLEGCPYKCKVCPFGLADTQKGVTKIRKEFQRIKKHETIMKRLDPPENTTIIFPYGHAYWPNYANDRVLNALINDGRNVVVYTLGDYNIIKGLIDKFGDKIKIGVAFSTADETLAETWEPETPPIEERLNAIKYAIENNIGVTVWVRHFIGDNLSGLIKKLLDIGVSNIILTRHNLETLSDTRIKEVVEQNTDKAWLKRLAQLYKDGLLDKIHLGKSFAGLKEKLIKREIDPELKGTKKKKRRFFLRFLRRK